MAFGSCGGQPNSFEQVGGDVITTVTATRVFAFSEGIDLG